MGEQDVCFSGRIICETPLTLGALITPDPRVGEQVSLEIGAKLEIVPANLALVRTGDGMS